jgi:hypothetical protein
MPAPEPADLGPLAALAGTWEGAEGLDVAFANVSATVLETPFRERTTFAPFGPVANGSQNLFGLDYRTAAWRGDEEDPFHTEVGYWLWDATAGQVMRCFMVPRGSTVLAGGDAAPDAKTFTMAATLGSTTYGILSNQYLDVNARTVRYECTITVEGDDTFSYEETTTVEIAKLGGELAHTDRNRLHRVG